MCSRTSSSSEKLPLLLAGPILRKCTATELTLWLVTSEPLTASFSLFHPEDEQPFFSESVTTAEQIQVGLSAWVVMANMKGTFPVNTVLEYQLMTQRGDIADLVPSLLYSGEKRLSFSIKAQADYVLHGSCRNPPHYPSKDSLVAADEKVASQSVPERPALLMMSGDQIYADHVAGPMLDAIQQVIGLLGGLPEETFAQGPVANTQLLYQHDYNFYGRGG